LIEYFKLQEKNIIATCKTIYGYTFDGFLIFKFRGSPSGLISVQLPICVLESN